jgi:hypothetical protein
VLPALAGVEITSTRSAVLYWQPLLSLVLLGVLALIGLQTQYVNPGATFGAGGITDYVGLFLWGISSDIAQKTLQSLPALK